MQLLAFMEEKVPREHWAHTVAFDSFVYFPAAHAKHVEIWAKKPGLQSESDAATHSDQAMSHMQMTATNRIIKHTRVICFYIVLYHGIHTQKSIF
jgi:hypothetical protein